MARPPYIICKCGTKRAVPVHGAIPKRCVACRDADYRERKRLHNRERARQPHVKARRRKLREERGYW